MASEEFEYPPLGSGNDELGFDDEPFLQRCHAHASRNARDRLTGITGVASFAYDAFGRRQTATHGGIATRLEWANNEGVGFVAVFLNDKPLRWKRRSDGLAKC